ncbi:MAG: Na+/H+ antiporter subunit E [Thermomicrobiales bacterium]|nr:Na+/H+ antiporter subunit E [Thermomicrobiales bacterium]MCO5222117.1 Na+/H+ antiporter subunit E [Thermomicrobiales bacterium]
MTRAIGVVALLTLVFCLTLASTDPWDIVIGAVLGTVVYLLFHGELPAIPGKPKNERPSFPRRILAFFPFAGITIWEILVGSVRVALVVIGLRKLEHPGIVAVPIGDRSRFGVVVTGITTTLSPGSILLDVDWDRGMMLVHVIDASDPDQVRADMQELYDRYQRWVFP